MGKSNKRNRKSELPSGAPNVALLIDTATDWGRRIIRGIIQYTYEQERWNVWLRPNVQEHSIRLPSGWCGDGIIARVANQSRAQHIKKAGVPVVNICASHVPGVHLPRVTVDLQAAGKLSAEYFLDLGFRNFAYYGPQRQSYVKEHYSAFKKVAQQAGFSCHLYQPKLKSHDKTIWQTEQQGLIHWLEQLPKPVALMTWTTDRGQEVINVCRLAGIIVPEQVAVLAADDDSLLCKSCNPPLSGISLSTERLGYEAAALLGKLMKGYDDPSHPVLIEPGVLTERQSTETLAIEDTELAQAVAFIRKHAAQPIQVANVLRVVPLSRRELERRMQKTLGRTPALEIRRVHIERAKRLLVETNSPIPDVALASGFASREHFAQLFKHETGMSPLRYRRNRLAK